MSVSTIMIVPTLYRIISAIALHRCANDTSDLLRRLDKVPICKIGCTRRPFSSPPVF